MLIHLSVTSQLSKVFWEYISRDFQERIDSKLDKEFFSSVVDHYILIYLYLKYNIYNMYREWTDLTNKIEKIEKMVSPEENTVIFS